MFVDSRSIPSNQSIDTDICIVGAGISGITMAREFSTAGFKTVLIESGGLTPDKTTISLNWGENVGIPYYPLDISRGRFFGGSSQYWRIKLPEGGLGVRLRPMDPIDFEYRDWIPYSGWPFPKSVLDPYYERAQVVCQIGAYRYDTDYWASDDRRPLPFKNDEVQTTMFQFAEREVVTKQYKKELEDSSQVSVYINGNVTEIETSENTGTVTRFCVDCLQGNRFFINAKYYVLAMGAIETARLLLLSDKTCNKGVGNQNDLVGRFFMEHPHLWSGRFVPANLKISNSTGLYQLFRKDGVPLLAKLTISADTLRNEKLANWCTSIHPKYSFSRWHYLQFDKKGVTALRAFKNELTRKAPTPANASVTRHIPDILADPTSIGRSVLRLLKGTFKKEFERGRHVAVFHLNHMAEQTPNPDSRVMLTDERDALGQRRLKLDWRLNATDIRTLTRAQEIVDRQLRQAGLGYLIIESQADKIPDDIHGGWHHMGTTRMHEDPKQGVVDANCCVHGTSNLFVAGASTFPTVGYANPVLTTVAVVLRLSDHLKQLMA